MTLFITNLPTQTTEQDLDILFCRFTPSWCKISRARDGSSLGMGHVEIYGLKAAIAASEQMHLYKIGKNKINVFLTPKKLSLLGKRTFDRNDLFYLENKSPYF